jgi:hypothetical protein
MTPLGITAQLRKTGSNVDSLLHLRVKVSCPANSRRQVTSLEILYNCLQLGFANIQLCDKFTLFKQTLNCSQVSLCSQA